MTFDDIRAARAAIGGLARVTPLLHSHALFEMCGADTWLKAEVLQRTGSFKVRGAVNFLHDLGPAERSRGVLAVSAGNHAQEVAAGVGLALKSARPTIRIVEVQAAARSVAGAIVMRGPPRASTAIGAEGATEVRPVTLPPYRLVLHNDDVNTMDYVVHSLLACVPELDTEGATAVMLKAHHDGKALVIVCPLERCELYRDRLKRRGLTATVERA